MNATTHGSGLPAHIELDGDEDPPWSRDPYADEREGIVPRGEASSLFFYEPRPSEPSW